MHYQKPGFFEKPGFLVHIYFLKNAMNPKVFSPHMPKEVLEPR